MPDYIRKHIQKNDSINFQVIGARGKGKSTMVRHLLEIENKADDGNKNLPETGSSDTTREPTPYKFRGIYLWDMPGLGGKEHSVQLHIMNFLKIWFLGIETSELNWEDFLKKFGTGYFDKTYLLCNANEGINEMELYFLRHLVHNKRNTALVVSNIDSLMAAEHMDFLKGRMDQETFEKRLETQKQKFIATLQSKVKSMLPGSELPKLGNRQIFGSKILQILYLPVNSVFTDFKDVLFISHPSSDEDFQGYKCLVHNLAESLKQ